MTGKRERKQIATPDPSLVMVVTDDGSRTLKCLESGVTWHSESGALAESLLVFQTNSGIAGRFAGREPARVLEIGFGTGLNFWITASLAARSFAKLEYFSLEPGLPDCRVVACLDHGRLDDCQPAFDQFFPQISIQAELSQMDIRISCGGVGLVIWRQEFGQFDFSESPLFDAVYHDPFGPDNAPELWTPDVFQSLYRLLRPGGSLVTWCVKSDVQRTLKAAGFEVSKTSGPVGGKREVLVAKRPR